MSFSRVALCWYPRDQTLHSSCRAKVPLRSAYFQTGKRKHFLTSIFMTSQANIGPSLSLVLVCFITTLDRHDLCARTLDHEAEPICYFHTQALPLHFKECLCFLSLRQGFLYHH